MYADFTWVPPLRPTRIGKVKVAFSLPIIGPRVCNMESTYGKS